jgi:hypothetical protein
MTRRAKTGVTRMTTGIVPMGTRPVASLHRRSAVEGMAETNMTCVMSSATEMQAARLKTGTEIGSVMSKSSAMRGTMTIMAPTTVSLTDNVLLKEDTFHEVSRLIPET